MLLSLSTRREKKKLFCSLYYFVDLQYKMVAMPVSTSRVACSHPANCECEKHAEKYVRGVTYFLYATIRQAIIRDASEALF